MLKTCHAWNQIAGLVIGLAICNTTAQLIPILPAAAARFSDVQQGYWAQRCIEDLARRGFVSGYSDGSFRPDAQVTRAEFAVMVERAFQGAVWGTLPGMPVDFVDVPSNYWAYTAIQKASEAQYLSGYPGKIFRPNRNITRAQVLVALASGNQFNSKPNRAVATMLTASFDDANSIPNYAKTQIAVATQNGWVVNYPNVRLLNPNRSANRAEVAAFLCQAVSQSSELVPLQYIVSPSNS